MLYLLPLVNYVRGDEAPWYLHIIKHPFDRLYMLPPYRSCDENKTTESNLEKQGTLRLLLINIHNSDLCTCRLVFKSRGGGAV